MVESRNGNINSLKLVKIYQSYFTECLDGNVLQLLRSLHRPGDRLDTDPVVGLGVEQQPDLPLHRHLLCHLGVVDEGGALASPGRHISGGDVLQTF